MSRSLRRKRRPVRSLVDRPGRAAARRRMERRLASEQLEARLLLAGDWLGWHNPLAPTDVDADGATNAADFVSVVGQLRDRGAGRLSGDQAATPQDQRLYVDVNDDGLLSPRDALLVYNALAPPDQTEALQIVGWHNPYKPTDVNADGATSPLDALIVFNELLASGPRLLVRAAAAPTASQAGEGEAGAGRYVDVNADNALSPLDALIVINQLVAEGQANAAPQIDLNGPGQTGSDFFYAYIRAQDPAKAARIDATLADVDSPSLASLTVTITNIQDAGNELLDADVTGTAITKNYDPATGVLTLSGPDTLANYQAVLRTVTYKNTAANPTLTPDRVIQFQADDGAAENNLSAVATTTMRVLDFGVKFRLAFTDLSGNPIASVLQGDDFKLQAWVQDLRGGTDPQMFGVFSAYLDAAYNNQALFSLTGVADPTDPAQFKAAFTVGPAFVQNTLTAENGEPGDPNVFSEVGAVANINPFDPQIPNPDQEKLLWEVTLTAEQPGQLQFAGNPADGVLSDTAVLQQNDELLPQNLKFDPPQVTLDILPPIDAIDDTFTNGGAVVEDSGANNLDVLANDVLHSAGAKDIDPNGFGVPDQGGTVTRVEVGGVPMVQYTPATDFVGVETFTYRAIDGLGNADVATVSVTVTNVNDAPVLTPGPAPGPTITTDEDTPIQVRLDGFINNPLLTESTTIADVDAGNPTPDPVGGIAIVDAVGNGQLAYSLDAGATFVDVAVQPTATNALLLPADAWIRYTPDGVDGETATMTYRAWDRSDGLAPGTFADTTSHGGVDPASSFSADTDTATVIVQAVNDPPVVDLNGANQGGVDFNAAYTEGDPPVPIADTDAAVLDVDSPTLASLTATITNLQDGAAEQLAADTAGTGITANYDPATGVLTLTGPASPADFQTVLRTVTYRNTAEHPDETPRVIEFQADDGAAANNLSNIATATVAVTGVNDPPVNNVPGPQQTNEDTPLLFSLNNGNEITVSDPDAGDDPIQVTLAVQNGVLTLSQTTGLTFTVGDGDQDATMTFTGSQTNINAAIGGNTITYTPNLNYNGPDTLTVTTNDQGANGDGGPRSDLDTVDITVNPVNDPPVNTLPDPVAVFPSAEWSAAQGNAISVADVDAGAAQITVSFQVNTGTLAIASTANLTVTGQGTSNLQLQGSIPDINAALAAGLAYQANPGSQADDKLTMTSNDGGAAGAGGPQTDVDQVDIIFKRPRAVNDQFAVNEDTANNPLDVLQNDIASDGATLVITGFTPPAHGQLQLSDNGTPAFGGDDFFQYTPDPNYFGPDTFTYTINDTADPNNDGPDIGTVNITVNPVNDAPVNTVPGDQATDEDTPLALTGGDAVSVADIDAGGSPVQVTLSVNNGVLGVTGGPGVTVADNNTGTVTLTGAIADLNPVLSTLVYTPDQDFAGGDTLTVTTNDQGATGAPGPLEDVDTVNITVNPVNDAPAHTVPGAQQTDEDTPLAFSTANGNAISISDVDAGADPVQVTLSVLNGVLTLSQTTGLTFTAGDGVQDQTMTFTGSLADINAALGGNTLTYAPNQDYNGPDTLTITTNDQGHNGAPTGEEVNGGLERTDTVQITVNPVNDAPVNTVPGAQQTAEDTPLELSGQNALQIADVDAGENPVQVSLSVEHGVLTLSQTTGLTFTGGGNGQASMTFTGLVADINAALGGNTLTYTPDQDYNGPDTLTVTTNDLGNTGSPGPLADTDTVDITVTPVNDAPIANDDPDGGGSILILNIGGPQPVDVLSNDLPGPATAVDEAGQTLTIQSFTFAGNRVEQATPGTPIATDQGGTIVVAADGKSFTYEPGAGFLGLDVFDYTVADDGRTDGAADPKTDTATVTLEVVEYVPSTIHGYVFKDGDNDGQWDAGERPLGGVQLHLTGVDTFSRAVDRWTTTGPDGSYAFADLAPSGQYTIAEVQPPAMLDGQESAVNATVQDPDRSFVNVAHPANDTFTVAIGQLGGADVRLDFGERGIDIQQFDPSTNPGVILDFLASSNSNGATMVVNPDGDVDWFSAGDQWDDLTPTNLDLSPDMATAQLTFHQPGGPDIVVTLSRAAGQFRLARLADGSHLVRITLTADQLLALAPPPGGGEGEAAVELAAALRASDSARYAEAVDELFGGPWL